MLATLDELGLARNTVVIFTSDHGDWVADHGMMQKGPLHYRGLIRVPFVWSDPQSSAGTGRTQELAGTLDIARTILARAGLAPHNGLQGHALGPIMEHCAVSAHDGMLIEQTTQRPVPGFDRPVRVRTFVDQRWRITLWSGVERGEMYDLDADPYEQTNLWDDPPQREQRAELIRRMLVTSIDLQDWAPMQTQQA